MGRRVYHSPESHRVRYLTMEPDILVCREEPLKPGPNDTNDVTEHRNEDKTAIKGEDETSTTGSPHGECQTVEGSEFRVCCL